MYVTLLHNSSGISRPRHAGQSSRGTHRWHLGPAASGVLWGLVRPLLQQLQHALTQTGAGLQADEGNTQSLRRRESGSCTCSLIAQQRAAYGFMCNVEQGAGPAAVHDTASAVKPCRVVAPDAGGQQRACRGTHTGLHTPGPPAERCLAAQRPSVARCCNLSIVCVEEG